MGHLAIVASFIIKFGASRGGFSIIDCRSNGRDGKGTSAEYSFRFEIVIVEADDVPYAAGDCACDGAGSSHPSFRWKGVDIGG